MRASGLQLYDKETLAQVFSCEFHEIFKNIFLQNTSGGCFWVLWSTMAIKNQADIRKTLELVLVDNASSASLLHRSLVFVKVFSFQPIK